MDDKLSLIGAWLGHVTHYKITGAAESTVVRFCTRVGYINSMQQYDISPTRGRGYGHGTILKFCR